MPLGDIYNTGTISVTNGSDTIVGAGVIWTDVIEGDDIYCNGLVGTVDSVGFYYDEITLKAPWQGSNDTGADYYIVKKSWSRYDPALTQSKLREFLDTLNPSNLVSYPIPGLTPGGRLTLTGSTPVMRSDVVNGQWLYYALHKHDRCPIYDGTAWVDHQFTEQVLGLDGDSGHTNYLQSGKLFDVFFANVAGVYYFGYGPAWTNDTTRSAALTRLNGIKVNFATMTLRHGFAPGDTVSVPANQATYLGTILASVNGAVTMQMVPASAANPTAVMGVYNEYNKVPMMCRVTESTNNWSYSSSTPRAVNGGGNNITFVDGGGEANVRAYYQVFAGATSASNWIIYIGLAMDWSSGSTTFVSAEYADSAVGNTHSQIIEAFFVPAAGKHTIQAVEWAHGSFGFVAYGDGWWNQTQFLKIELEM